MVWMPASEFSYTQVKTVAQSRIWQDYDTLLWAADDEWAINDECCRRYDVPGVVKQVMLSSREDHVSTCTRHVDF